ncbi:MAG: GHKL domain-containing protein [Clostridiales bacterium]|nr:GHKL domain-containing protein [Clostridiales bacterium]
MDTKWKKFRYSFFGKFLCFLLAIITFASSAGIGIYMFLVGYYCELDFNDASNISWYESNPFEIKFSQDTLQAIYNAEYDYNYETMSKILDDEQEAVIEYVYQEALSCKESDPDGTTDHVINYTVNFEDFSASTFTYNLDFGNTDYGDNFDGYRSDSTIKYEIKNEYLLFKDDTLSTYSSDAYSYDLSECVNFKYYITDNRNGEVYTNLENQPDENELKSNPVYMIISDGKIQDMSASLNKNEEISANKKLTCYFYVTDEESGDFYGSLIGFANQSEYMRSNPYQCITLAVVLLIISFIAGFRFFAVCGKSEKDEKAKLCPTDYIPIELHLGAYVGLTFAVICIAIEMADASSLALLSNTSAFLLTVTFTVVWLMLFEFCCCVARSIFSERKFYKFFLVYWILKLVLIIFKTIGKLFIGLSKKFKSSGKKFARTISYKPKIFKRNLIVFTVLYALFKLMLFMVSIVFAMNYDPFSSSVAVALILIPDFIIAPFVIRYIVNLDKIIIASNERSSFIEDIDSLPNSLAMLAQSMKYTNTELQNAVTKAVKDERLRTELITNVSHDLKTPLTSIVTYVDLLSKCDINDEKAKQYIAVLDEKGKKLKRLIDDLIEASKVTSGSIQINPTKMNLSELCLQATVDEQKNFEKAGLELIIKQGEKPTIIFADGAKTNRIIENLLSNARKYSAKASRVYASVYSEGNYGVFELKNISAQQLDITPDELTERFVRGDKSRNEEGNGLGLSIAKELCKAQNGKLELIIDGDLFKAKVKLPSESLSNEANTEANKNI